MQKHQIGNFVFDYLHTSPFDGPSPSGRPQIEKLKGTKGSLNLILGRSLFAQTLNSKIFYITPSGVACLGCPSASG